LKTFDSSQRDEAAMMLKNGKIKEIWGRQFRIVKNGLDEVEVFSFISRLIEQNADLSSRLEHVDSLKKLAEKAVIQAARQAQRIREEALEKANEEAESIVSLAKEEGQAQAERIIAEADNEARERISASEALAQDMVNTAEEKALAQAEKIIADVEGKAREEAETIVSEALQMSESTVQEKILSAENRADAIIKEAEAKAEAMVSPATEEARNILAEVKEKNEAADNMAREIIAKAEEKAESILAQAEGEANRTIEEMKQKAEYAVELKLAKAEEEGRRIIEEATKAASMEAQRIRDEVDEMALKGRKTGDDQLKEKFDRLCDILLANSLESKARKIVPSEVIEADEIFEEGPPLYQGTVLLDFPPPLDSSRVLKIHKHLSKIPQIKVLDVKGSARGGIRISLYLRSQFPLLESLKDLPEVERVTDGLKPAEKLAALHKHGEAAPSRIVVTTKS